MAKEIGMIYGFIVIRLALLYLSTTMSSNIMTQIYTERVLINGEAHHIYTVISVVANDQGNAAESINLRVVIDGSGQDIQLIQSQSLAANGTYVWNERIVLQGTDHLEAYNSAGNVDWYVSYIEQDWS